MIALMVGKFVRYEFEKAKAPVRRKRTRSQVVSVLRDSPVKNWRKEALKPLYIQRYDD